MDIIFYRTESEPERMTKTLENALTLSGYLRNDTDVVTPVITIEGDISIYAGAYNYAFIPAFNRYYFITDINSYRTGIIYVSLNVDVLMSFKQSILSNVAIVDKQQSAGNYYLNDGSWLKDSREFYTIKTFENGFNDNGEYILITAGA